MTLPANVGHGTVRGRFIDSNGTSITGKVTFAPTPKRLLNATAEPTPVTILPKPVTVDLDGGEFVTTLIATDDPDNNPQGWNYRVSFNFQGAQADPFNIEVPEGETVDLTTVAPVSASGGTPIIRGPAGVGVPDYEGVEDGKVLILVDGEPTWGDAPGGGGGGGPVAWDDVEDKPSTFPPDSHAHEIGDVTGLQAALDDKQDAGSYAPATHTHTVSDVTGLQSALDAKADAASVTSALAGKANSSHSHGIADLPAGTTITVSFSGTWPARPTARTDVVVFWVGGTTGAPPAGALAGDIHLPDAT